MANNPQSDRGLSRAAARRSSSTTRAGAWPPSTARSLTLIGEERPDHLPEALPPPARRAPAVDLGRGRGRPRVPVGVPGRVQRRRALVPGATCRPRRTHGVETWRCERGPRRRRGGRRPGTRKRIRGRRSRPARDDEAASASNRRLGGGGRRKRRGGRGTAAVRRGPRSPGRVERRRCGVPGLRAAGDCARGLCGSAGRGRRRIRPAAAGRDGSRGDCRRERARTRPGSATRVRRASRADAARSRGRPGRRSRELRGVLRCGACPGSSGCRRCDRLVRRQDRGSRCGCEWLVADPDIRTARAREPRRHVRVVDRRARRHCHFARGVATATECGRGRGEHRRGPEGRRGIVTSCLVVRRDRGGVDRRPRDRRAQRRE